MGAGAEDAGVHQKVGLAGIPEHEGPGARDVGDAQDIADVTPRNDDLHNCFVGLDVFAPHGGSADSQLVVGSFFAFHGSSSAAQCASVLAQAHV